MLKINLVPEVQAKKNKVKKVNSLSVLVAAIVLGSTVALLLSGFAYNNVLKAVIKKYDNEIASLNKDLEQYKELEKTVLQLEKGIDGVKTILSSEYSYTKLFPHLEAATPVDVQFTKLKVDKATLEASVKGRDIGAFSKLIASLKSYKVMSLRASGAEPLSAVSITVDGDKTFVTKSKPTGDWVMALGVDLKTDHEIKIKVGSEGQENTFKYLADGQKLEPVDGGAISMTIKELYSTVETTGYQKEGAIIKSDIKMTYDGGLLW